MRLFLSRVHFPITALGFGRRVGIWFQGCSIRCPGCVSADTWPMNRGETTVGVVCDAVAGWLSQADGLTVSGGEPFDQPDALLALLRDLRASCRGDVLLYSGRSLEELKGMIGELQGLVDVLICDRFDATAGQTLALRGSDNQRMVFLSDLGRDRYGHLATARSDARRAVLDLFLDEDGGAWFAGIPRLGDMRRLKALIEQQGFRAAVTEASERHD
jgi:anaerobic ribonucleoside-triphosphate reductase activating protein